MNFYLVCVHPFGDYAKGQVITDPDEVARLTSDRDHHFVRIPAPVPDPAPAPSRAPKK
jgi:hypothetical protein